MYVISMVAAPDIGAVVDDGQRCKLKRCRPSGEHVLIMCGYCDIMIQNVGNMCYFVAF